MGNSLPYIGKEDHAVGERCDIAASAAELTIPLRCMLCPHHKATWHFNSPSRARTLVERSSGKRGCSVVCETCRLIVVLAC